ncbi:hypothetical protein [Geochorda subterranea]|uniref:site-specific DNA-methyltransferase (cytosine-N(4)-specific) n=1 Tax=Geochorda subterranea TaxID=3109564 RepID=A0ABZ1BSN4_9FIRM|nr:hypothetical protein [Limnochorda sp. LNt]WRP15806.1 hypothetical protein VLY81_06540 [Limnochorda sp. LNt]
MGSGIQTPLFTGSPRDRDARWQAGSSTFVHNMTLPVHRWFRFPAGFSAQWAQAVVEEQRRAGGGRAITLLDPFAGVGTAILAAEAAGVRAYGLEAQPLLARIARAKLLWDTDVGAFLGFARRVLEAARDGQHGAASYPPLVLKCYPPDVLQQLHGLRLAWEAHRDGSPESELTWLALVSILRQASPANTAPWQYVLPSKRKRRAAPPYDAFAAQVERMAQDMAQRQAAGVARAGSIFAADARQAAPIEDGSIDLVVTSPPYANNFDYADATRLELSFLGAVEGWGDLHEVARRPLVRSCSQHVSVEGTDLEAVLRELSDAPFYRDLERVVAALAQERERHRGHKRYDVMIPAYFADMRQVWRALRRVCRPGARVCFVVGDSAPYGVHIPVERWLGELAVQAGFGGYRFEKIRDRNVKWKNRKHRVPLHEGHLWVEG